MPKVIKIVLALSILVGVGIWVFFIEAPKSGNGTTSTPATSSSQANQSIPDNWEVYSNAQYDFSIAHPPEISVQSEGISQKNHIKFTYLGDNNATGEITDGFTLTVSSYDKTETEAGTLQDFARTRIADNPVSDVVIPVEATRFNGQPAAYYQTRNLGIVDHVVVENDDAFVVISSNVADPNNQGYDQIVSDMKSSLRLEEVAVGDTADSARNQITLAMLDTEIPEGQTPDRGCDRVAMITRNIPETSAPLTAAMNALFALDREQVEGFYNFIARTNDTLSFEQATVDNGTASIYLTGELSGLAGVCDNPRAKIQIEETALQFPTVETVQIYLNGEPTELQPNGQG